MMTNVKDNGGQAFPRVVEQTNGYMRSAEGMSLRDYFAAPAPDPEGTKCITHEAIAAALTEGRPLNQMQRACLLGLVDADKRKQTCYDAAIQDSERYRWLKRCDTEGGAAVWSWVNDPSPNGFTSIRAGGTTNVQGHFDSLDKAIDAAIAASNKGGAA